MKALLTLHENRVRHQLLEALLARGHDVSLHDDQDAAWQAYARDRHPLVILGSREGRAADLVARFRTPPFGAETVILTVEAAGGAFEDLLTAGADDVLLQPIETRPLAARLAVAERLAAERSEIVRACAAAGELRRAVHAMQIGVTLTDRDGVILYTNPADARMHGYEVAELVGRNARLFSPRGSWRAIGLEETRVVKGWARERLNVRKDGSVFPARLVSDVVTDENGTPVGIVTSCEDVAERWSAEAQHAIRFDVARLLAAATSARDVIPRVLRVACEGAGWRRGELWRLDAEAGVLSLDGVFSPAPPDSGLDLVSNESKYAPGEGLVGRALRTGEPRRRRVCVSPSRSRSRTDAS